MFFHHYTILITDMMILAVLDHLIVLVMATMAVILGALWSLRSQLAAHYEEEAAEQERERERLIFADRRGLH